MTDQAQEYTPFRDSVKGKRMRFFEAQGVDELANISLALAQELWALRARYVLLERAVIEAGLLDPEGVAGRPDALLDGDGERQERQEFIDRIFFTLREEAEALNAASPAEPEPPQLS